MGFMNNLMKAVSEGIKRRLPGNLFKIPTAKVLPKVSVLGRLGKWVSKFGDALQRAGGVTSTETMRRDIASFRAIKKYEEPLRKLKGSERIPFSIMNPRKLNSNRQFLSVGRFITRNTKTGQVREQIWSTYHNDNLTKDEILQKLKEQFFYTESQPDSEIEGENLLAVEFNTRYKPVR